MKFFAINKNQAAVLATLMVLIFLGALYFFIYLPNNEKRIQEQRFNALQHIDRNIHTKIENSTALLNNLLTAYQAAGKTGRDSLMDYITNYPTNNFTITTPVVNSPRQKAAGKDSLTLDSTYTISVNNVTREISLSFLRKDTDRDTSYYSMGMKFSFSQFILFLLPKDVFDEYIIFSKGRPVYESFPAGISYVKEDSLLSAKNGFGSAGIRNQLISGTDYKMFLQPVGFDASNEWVIAGLLTSKHYQSEKTELPTQAVLLLATILLICMVAFPWLKLYQMGSKDRLTISDGVASIFISMLLMSLIFFVFFNYNVPFRPQQNKEAKLTLANGIYQAFKTELDTAYNKLVQLDNLVVPGSGDMVNVNNDAIAASGGKAAPANINAIKDAVKGIQINQVFWLDKNGDGKITWTADNKNAPHGNFKLREYFKQIEEHREYQMNDAPGKGFFLDQVVSWTSGTFRSVLSMRSRLSTADSLVVAGLSFNFNSLDKVVLPTGFLFAITDNAGNVLYHSEQSRNLNENLLNVFTKSNQLKGYLDASVPGSFTTKYYGKDYAIQVKPVNGLPYFIIIFEDMVYSETRDMETYSFTFTMLTLFFLFLVLQLLAIFLVSAKRSFFKKQLLDTSWIGPKIPSHKEYVLSTVFNSLVILLLALFLNHATFLQYLFMLLLAVTFVPLFLNSIFAQRYSEERRNVLQFKSLAKYCLWAFVAGIEILAFKLLDLPNFLYLLGYQLLIVAVGVVLYITRTKIYHAASLIKSSGRCKLLFGKWNYVNSFALMSLTRLLITSGLPVVFFYISSHNYEQNLNVRYQQLEFANRLVNKFAGQPLSVIINNSNGWHGIYHDSSAINKVSIVSDKQALAGKRTLGYSKEELRTLELLKLFRLYLTDKAVVEDKFYTRGAADSSFLFNDLLREAIAKDAGTTTYRKLATPGQYLAIQSENLNYHYPSVFSVTSFRGGLFWLLLAGTMVMFYFIILSIVKKLFSLNLPNVEVWQKLDKEILKNKSWDQPLFVIGLPGAGKKKYLLDKISNNEIVTETGEVLCCTEGDEKNNVFIAELVNIPTADNEVAEKEIWNEYTRQVFDAKNRIIIVNHFEYNIQDSTSNRFKLEFLERLYLENKCKIIILSTIHPVAFLDSAMDHLPKTADASIPGQDLERWHVLLGHYRIVVLPLQLRSTRPANAPLQGSVVNDTDARGLADIDIQIKGTAIKTSTISDGRFILPAQPMPFTLIVSCEGYVTKTVEILTPGNLHAIILSKSDSYISAQLIRQETNHTYFLKRMQAPAFEAGRSLTEEQRIEYFDELAFKLQVSSHYFYMYIWQSLTKEEKFLLYDLAEDNLVNSFDDYNLSMLIAKGVVIRPDGTLRLFNKGFRNFILTAIGNSEAIKIKNRIKDNGNWSTLKNPIQLVILAILAFLLTSQEEAFAKLLTYVAALGAGVPAVLKLVNLFDKNSEKTN